MKVNRNHKKFEIFIKKTKILIFNNTYFNKLSFLTLKMSYDMRTFSINMTNHNKLIFHIK